jgi:membrane protein YqaA with SNARE-associated domain
MSEPFDGLVGWAMDVLLALGYAGLVGLVALETVFPPIPPELILSLAGFLTGQGRLAFPGAVAAATLGSVLGALGFYTVGRALGEARLRSLVRRYGHSLLINDQDLARAHYARLARPEQPGGHADHAAARHEPGGVDLEPDEQTGCQDCQHGGWRVHHGGPPQLQGNCRHQPQRRGIDAIKGCARPG